MNPTDSKLLRGIRYGLQFTVEALVLLWLLFMAVYA